VHMCTPMSYAGSAPAREWRPRREIEVPSSVHSFISSGLVCLRGELIN
jgi:hypothetical protein